MYFWSKKESFEINSKKLRENISDSSSIYDFFSIELFFEGSMDVKGLSI